MGNTLFSTSEVLNALTNTAAAPTPTPAASSLFPISYLFDGDIASDFRFGSVAANAQIVADLNQILNGGLETWTGGTDVPTDCFDDSTGTGDLEQEATIKNSGSFSCKLTANGGGNLAILRFKDRPFRAGMPINVTVALGGDGTNPISAYVQNRQTQKYLQSNGTWTGSKTAIHTQSAASFSVLSTVNATVEAATVAGLPVYDIRCTVELSAASSTGYVDDFYAWPGWDLGAIFGHNFSSGLTSIRLQSDSDPAFPSPTDQCTFTLRHPSMFKVAGSTVIERYLRLLLSGTNHDPPEIGELVVCMKTALPRAIRLPYDISPRVALLGREQGRPIAMEDRESCFIPYSALVSNANWDDLRVTLLAASRWGGFRTLLVPDDARPEVHFGTLLDWAVSRTGSGSHHEVRGTLEEQRYGVRVL